MAVLQSIRNLFVPAIAPEPEVIVPAPFTTYEIRPLTIKNIDTVVRLNIRCFRSGENYAKHTFNYLLTQPQSLAYAAFTPFGDMVGFVLVMNNPDGAAHITTVGVAPEHRRRGIAERLIHYVDEALLARRVSMVMLEVRVSNIAAQRLYLSCGYAVTQRMNRYYQNGEDAFLMVKSLA